MMGIDVILYEKTQRGVDGFGDPIYNETPTTVHDVLVAPASAQEILDNVNLYGKKAVYTLGIPKNDTHDWTDKHVAFFGRNWQAFGIPVEGIAENVPTRWHKKVMVAVYE